MIQITEQHVATKIYFIRNQKIMLDSDLAELYGVETRVLNQAVKRNLHRFPEDFMFQLTEKEYLTNLKSQIVTSSAITGKIKWGGNRKLPYAFTEHGTVMLASVLNSERAVAVSLQVVRIFIKLRQILETNKELAQKIEQFEEKYDNQFKIVFDAIKQLLTQEENVKTEPIGFKLAKK
jgi:hypothetical protein